MINQVRAALLTYTTRVAFQVFAVSLPAILLVCWGLTLDARPGLSHLILLVPAAAIFFAILGDQLRVQLTSWRSKLCANYVSSHFIAALVLTVLLALMLVWSSLAYSVAESWMHAVRPQVPALRIFAVVWSFSLLALAAGYFFRGQFLFLFLLAGTMNSSIAQWVDGMERWTAMLVVVADLLLTVALVMRMRSASEDAFEYRWKDTPGEFRRYLWTRWTWTFHLPWRRKRALDYRLDGSVISHVRHFASAMRTTQQSILTTAAYVAVFWALNLLMARSSLIIPDVIVLTPFPAMMVFLQMKRGLSVNLPSIFLLPLRREQIVSRFGLALFVVLLEDWLAFAVALILVSWMPFPGRIAAFPSMRPYIISIITQAPIFGLLGLGLGRSRLHMIGLTSLVVMVVAMLSYAGVQWTVIAALISGPPLIWFSYRHWCRAELA